MKTATVNGRVSALHIWPSSEAAPVGVDRLVLDFGGPIGDRHYGVTARSDVRQRWLYAEGTEIRNNRQVSLVDEGELAIVAARLGIDQLAPGTIADNICTTGIDELSSLAPLSRLIFGNEGPVLAVLGTNNPCTIAGGLVAARYGTNAEKFPKAAMRHRGVTAWVERPGTVQPGMVVRVESARPSG